MSLLRKLAGQTVTYGVSTIVGRLLNYLLVPLYTQLFVPAEYGIITDLYAYLAFFNVVYALGLETAYFYFANQANVEPGRFARTAQTMIGGFVVVCTFFLLWLAPDIAVLLKYPDQASFVRWMALILLADALMVVPFAVLRKEGRARFFVAVKLAFVLLNIGFNLLFLLLLPQLGLLPAPSSAEHEMGVGVVLVCNVLASGIALLLLGKVWLKIGLGLDRAVSGQMLAYAWPMIIVGLATTANEVLDRSLLKYLLPGSIVENLRDVGIYGACYKLAIFMSLATQAFRYAAEPFFFSMQKEASPQQGYAEVMKWFVIAGCCIFLGVSLYIDLFKIIINDRYWSGLHIVPILLIANLFLGVYYNLSVWYKVSNRTYWGAIISSFGLAITIGVNLLLIPIWGYTGSAWATLACYLSMTLASATLGRKFYPVPYKLPSMLLYLMAALILWYLSNHINLEYLWQTLLVNTSFILAFLLLVLLKEKPIFLINLKAFSRK